MSEPSTPKGDPDSSKKRGGLLYKLALASVGSVKLAQEELSSLFRRAPEVPRDPSEPEAPPLPLQASPAAEDRIDSTINKVLASLTVASRGDVQALQGEVEALAVRLEAFRAKRS